MRLKDIKHKIGCIVYDDIFYIIINYFVAYIPCWTIRKLLYQCFGMVIGHGSRIAMRCVVMGQKGCHGIVIGENNVINEYCLLDGRSGLVLGNNNNLEYSDLETLSDTEYKKYAKKYEEINASYELVK